MITAGLGQEPLIRNPSAWLALSEGTRLRVSRTGVYLLFCGGFLLFSQVAVSAQDRAFVEAQIKRWTEQVRENPRDFETLAAIGSAYGKLGRHETALEYFEKAISVNPNYADAYLGEASSYGFLGRINDKIAAARKAATLDPANALAYANLGSALGKAGRYQESKEALKEAIRLRPTFAEAHFALGLVYLSLGDRVLATKEAETLRRIDPALAKQLKDTMAASGRKK
jgi:tetratricopeptide (TPR) repeat protein